MAEVIAPLSKQDDTNSEHQLFWLTLVAGAISGASNYFILRFNEGLTWYVLAPILCIISFIFIYFFTCKRLSGGETFVFRSTLRFTGTWVITYFVVGTAIFYFGW